LKTPKIRIAEILHPVFAPYNKPACEIYVSGCTRNCKGCHNPELQDFDVGYLVNMEDLKKTLEELSRFYEIVAISGGDILCYPLEEAYEFCKQIRNMVIDKEFWLFTGAEKKELPKWCFDIFDYIKIGSFDIAKFQDGFPASSNQKLLKKGEGY
jgi:anaerobic ribonucleoside-triphosphate reductase activating protein